MTFPGVGLAVGYCAGTSFGTGNGFNVGLFMVPNGGFVTKLLLGDIG